MQLSREYADDPMRVSHLFGAVRDLCIDSGTNFNGTLSTHVMFLTNHYFRRVFVGGAPRRHCRGLRDELCQSFEGQEYPKSCQARCWTSGRPRRNW